MWLLDKGFPSFSVGVTRGDSLVYSRSFGISNRRTGEAATPSTIYQIGSVTKMFTGLLLARMVEADVVRLGDPVARYLPDGVAVPSDTSDAVITLQHLATHTSGLPRYPPNLERQDGDPMTGYTADELYRGLADTRLVHSVGTTWHYSNFGYGLLAHLLEQAAGVQLQDLLDRFVLTSTDRGAITLEPTTDQRARLAIPYRDEDTDIPTVPWDMGTLQGAGGLFASINDLSAFAGHLMEANGTGVDPSMREAVRLMQTPFYRFRSAEYTSWGYGLGNFVVEDWQGTGQTVVWHGGDLDGYAASLIVAPDARMAVMFLTNTSIGSTLEASGVNEWLLPAALAAFDQEED